MRAGSLIVLGAVFLSAFAGRAAILTTAIAHDGDGAPAGDAPVKTCVDGAFAQTLKDGLARLEERKVEFAEETETAKVFAAHVEKRLGELEALSNSVAASLRAIEAARNEDARRVASIYEQMKPPLAGAIIGAMDADFAAGLLLAMNAESASAIMATLDADRAYAITVLMAGAAKDNAHAADR